MEPKRIVEQLTANGQRLLKPITTLLLTLYIVSFGVISFFTYELINSVYTDSIRGEFEKITRFYNDQIDDQTELQELILHGLLSNSEIVTALKQSTSFEQFDVKFQRFSVNNVSHLYFISSQREVLYRAHSPNRKGDVISRATMLDAANHNKVTSGLEFGVLGTFTLRSVAPVFQEGENVGYIELGMELGHVAKKTERQFSIQLVEFFDKNLIDIDDTQAFMQIAGRISDTQTDSQYLINHNPETPLPQYVLNEFRNHFSNAKNSFFQISETQHALLEPMVDHSLKLVGHKAFIMDTAKLVEERNTSFINALIALIVLVTVTIGIFAYVLRYVELVVQDHSDESRRKEDALKRTIAQLESAQTKMIEQEKFASLGSMVAGVAHEISTPLGISLTAVTSLSSEVQKLKHYAETGQLTKSQLNTFTTTATEMSQLVERNLLRGADLLQSFKKVAVDQSSGSARKVQFCEFLNEVISSMGPTLSKSTHSVTIQCDDDLVFKTIPGYWSQIVINLISNSLKHGFDGIKTGSISIQVTHVQQEIVLRYSDNGIGIRTDSKHRIFEPFYTTKRDSGGSGLGLHLVYNLINLRSV